MSEPNASTSRDGGARLGVLASGSGTVLGAILDAGLPVVVVAADRPCRATSLAETAGVPAVTVLRDSYGSDFDRSAYTRRVVATLEDFGVDVVAMAGFGTVLGPAIFERWSGRVLNTHPALLPAFKGWHAVANALSAGVATTGCTVHVATEAVDAGPILAQETVPVEPDDTESRLHERIKVVERRLYPAAIAAFLSGIKRSLDPVAGDHLNDEQPRAENRMSVDQR
ncbi:MAG: phosphoribosylglycinamide formyltransferase [Actinomycetota bacterium]|nr:phosphoribosylglycinamide formyltransferase [Actinomycetota bacterium]